MIENIIETKICKCGAHFDITDKDLEFYEKISPIFNGEKYSIPTPALCPDCRQKRRLAWRNERKLYKRTCDATGKDIISIYSPDKPYKVYNQKDWWADIWNPLDYGLDFDFSKTFTEQFEELMLKVPRQSIINKNSENSEYSSNTLGDKNCYLTFISGENEDCAYGDTTVYSKNSIDMLWAINTQNCYQCVKIQDSFNCMFCLNIKSCNDCHYLIDSVGCDECQYSIGLKNKKYHILNKEYKKEAYFQIVESLKSNPQLKKSYLEEFQILKLKVPRQNLLKESSEDSFGDYLYNCKNSIDSYDLTLCENVRFAYADVEVVDSYDVYLSGPTQGGDPCALLYDVENVMDAYFTCFSSTVWNGKYVLYSDHCHNSSHLFGCTGLRNAEYCILNKKYTKEEYETLVPKIIEHMKKTLEWGEFFPSSISPFGYNETVANDYYPQTKEESLQRDFKWSDYEPPFPKVEKIIPAAKLPVDIKDVPDDILNWAVECEVSKKPFRIIKLELDFYRKHNLGIPHKHPDERHLDRMKQRNPRKLYDRNCDNCGIDIKTTYSPDRPEIVYCESCYNKEII